MNRASTTPGRRLESAADQASAASLRRTLAGIIGLLLLASAAALWVFGSEETSQLWMSSCLRVGLVMCLLWLAWPQFSRLHPWLIVGGLAGLIAVLAIGKGHVRIIPIVAVVLVILARARPRTHQRPRS